MDAWLGLKPKPTAQPTLNATNATSATAQIAETTAAPQYRIKQRNDGRFNIVNASGKALTTKPSREKAEQYIQGLLSGLVQPKAPTQAPTRSSSRISSKPTPLAPKIETRGRKSGAAWVGKRKEPEAITDPADAVLDYLQSNDAAKRSKIGVLAEKCAVAHKQLQSEQAELQKKYERARILLCAELGHDPGPLRRSQIAELVGTGYDDLQGRTIRRHKENVMATIRLHAGDSCYDCAS